MDQSPALQKGTRNAGLIERMFDNLRLDMPVVRWNWSVYGDAELFHPARTRNREKAASAPARLPKTSTYGSSARPCENCPKAAIFFSPSGSTSIR
jgi:hypothetical protein